MKRPLSLVLLKLILVVVVAFGGLCLAEARMCVDGRPSRPEKKL
jgi:hypothetical protein